MLTWFMDVSSQRRSGCTSPAKAAVRFWWNEVDFNLCPPKQTDIFRPAGHGVQTPTMVTFKMMLLGLFLGLIVLRPKL